MECGYNTHRETQTRGQRLGSCVTVSCLCYLGDGEKPPLLETRCPLYIFDLAEPSAENRFGDGQGADVPTNEAMIPRRDDLHTK